MPPRIRSAKFGSTTTCPLPRSQCTSQPAQQTRTFSQTSCQQVTLRRRKFYQWMNGPGAQLKDPIPGSTNYMGAYDKFGNLLRASPGWERPTAKPKVIAKENPTPGAEVEVEEVDGEMETDPAGQENPDALEKAVRLQESKADKEGESQVPSLPEETEEDLRPFPVNRFFYSQKVLSERLREEIYQRVRRDGATVSLTSVEFGVSNERVGAVVRLKQLEKEWIAQGKQLALPYSKAVLDMLPQTPYIDQTLPENRNARPVPHESINDLFVHPATRQQLFVPVAESRKFTRVDAGKAFHNDLLPADERIPHPELVLAEREIAEGYSLRERKARAGDRLEAEEAEKIAKDAAARAEELRNRHVVPQRRWDYVFTDVSVEQAGKNGRGAKGVGWRYGFPHEDRKKGQVKIPTRVEA